MVEYALVLAHNTTGLFAGLSSWVSEIPWQTVGYGILGLILLRVAIGAFRPNH
jgi:hypothetical protein